MIGCGSAASPAPSVTATIASPSAVTSPSSPATSPTPTATASPFPAATAAATSKPIVLRQAPDNMGCDAIGVDYKRMTFRLDPNAAEPVSATTDTGARLLTNWSAGFRQAPGGQLAIVDPAGKAVVTDGQVLEVPAASYPRLAGYFVCLGPSAIWVLIKDPT